MDYAKLPKVDQVAARVSEQLPGGGVRVLLTRAARQAVDALRQAGFPEEATREELYARAAEHALACYRTLARPSLRRVINATGVVLHTNLGRAPLAPEAARAAELAAGYCSLELDLEEGRRGSRYSHVAALIAELTGAEDALVVNNNAAAVLLVLDTLARGGEAVVSRGQLVEIGGSFRIPEVIERGGAVLREVGATNKTRLSDYENAIGEGTACLLQVHPSNFYMEGFVAEVSTAELSALAHAYNLPLIYDLGSGCLYPFFEKGVGREPLPARIIADGADVLTFSGDKLLGGPQAGIIAGRSVYLERLKKNPLIRALRIDKLTLAALEATLTLYRDGRAEDLPVVRMLTEPEETLRRRAEALLNLLADCRADTALARRVSPVGGGSMPEVTLPTWVVEVTPEALGLDEFLRRLRTGEPAVLGYLHENRACFDVRTIQDGELAPAAETIRSALS